MRLEIEVIEARMRAPVVSSRQAVETRALLLVKLHAGDGTVGYGEAAPLQSYDGVSVDDTHAALESCRELLTASDGDELEQLLAACREAAALPQALSAIDLALWDLAGRRSGQPVWRLLGAHEAPSVAVNASIAAPDRAGAAAEAATARKAGFQTIKVKVGVGDDAGRLAAVRAAAGSAMAIRLDANGTWEVQEALATLHALEPVGIELCEEPVSGLDAIAEVSSQTLVPIAIDESAEAPGALEARVCDAVCLKLARSGGISGLIEAATHARRVGYQVYIASTYDGPLGIAAAIHAAAIVRPELPCGLATLGLFADRADSLPPRNGRMEVPSGFGLGEGLSSWYGRSE